MSILKIKIKWETIIWNRIYCHPIKWKTKAGTTANTITSDYGRPYLISCFECSVITSV